MIDRLRWWSVVAMVAAIAGAVPMLLSGSEPGRELPAARDGADPLAQCAQLGHALQHAPWDPELYQAPWFWPTPWAQTFLDPMVAPSIVARVVPGAHERPVTAYQFVMWFSLASGLAATTALARRLGLGRAAALLAGVVFALGPASAWHWHHLNQLHAPWLCLALLAVDELLRGRRWGPAAVALVAIVAVQLQWSIYGTASTLVALIVYALVRGVSDRSRWVRTAFVIVPVVAVLWLGAQPYLAAAREVAGYGRGADEVLWFQARWGDFLRAPAAHLLPWPASDPTRAALYPGLVALALGAIGGLHALRQGRRPLLALAVVGVVGLLLAFGRSLPIPGTDVAIPSPFALAQDLWWPLQVLRVPARFVVLFALALAVGVGLGVERLWRRTGSRALVVGVVVLALADLAPGPIGKVRAALDPPERALAAALLRLPGEEAWMPFPVPCDESAEGAAQARWMLIALAAERPVAEGASGFVPRAVAERRRLCCDGADVDCTDRLREEGIEWLVLPAASVSLADSRARRVWQGREHELWHLLPGGDPGASLPETSNGD